MNRCQGGRRCHRGFHNITRLSTIKFGRLAIDFLIRLDFQRIFEDKNKADILAICIFAIFALRESTLLRAFYKRTSPIQNRFSIASRREKSDARALSDSETPSSPRYVSVITFIINNIRKVALIGYVSKETE